MSHPLHLVNTSLFRRKILPINATPSITGYSGGEIKPDDSDFRVTTMITTHLVWSTAQSQLAGDFSSTKTLYQGGRGKHGDHARHLSLQANYEDDTLGHVLCDISNRPITPRRKNYLKARDIDSPTINRISLSQDEDLVSPSKFKSSFSRTHFEKWTNMTLNCPANANHFDCLVDTAMRPKAEKLLQRVKKGEITPQESTLSLIRELLDFFDHCKPELEEKCHLLEEFGDLERQIDDLVDHPDPMTLSQLKSFIPLANDLIQTKIKLEEWTPYVPGVTIMHLVRSDWNFLANCASLQHIKPAKALDIFESEIRPYLHNHPMPHTLEEELLDQSFLIDLQQKYSDFITEIGYEYQYAQCYFSAEKIQEMYDLIFSAGAPPATSQSTFRVICSMLHPEKPNARKLDPLKSPSPKSKKPKT